MSDATRLFYLVLCIGSVYAQSQFLNPYTDRAVPPPDRVPCSSWAECQSTWPSTLPAPTDWHSTRAECLATRQGAFLCWNDLPGDIQSDGKGSCAWGVKPGTAGTGFDYCDDPKSHGYVACSKHPTQPHDVLYAFCSPNIGAVGPHLQGHAQYYGTAPPPPSPPLPPSPPPSPPPDVTAIYVGAGGGVVVILLLVVGVVCWCLKKKKDTKPAAPTSPEQVSDPMTGQPLSGTLEPVPVVMAVAPPPDVPVPIAPLAAQPAGVSAGVLQASSPPASLPSREPPGKFSSDCCACCENGIICCLTCCCPEIGLGQLFQRYSNYDAAGQKTNKCMVIVILVLVCYLGSLIFYSAANGAYLGWSGCYTDKLWSGASWFDAASECGMTPDAAYALYTIGFIFFAVWSLVQCFVLMIARQKIRRAHKIPSGYARSTTPACPIL